MKIPKKSHAIIIGSMKSGTTSLYNYLIEHPHICPAITKEPEFFSENQLHKIRLDKYSELWNYDKSKHKIALEASTGYTKYPFEPNVPKNMFEYGIKPKMIYCVRNPFDRILSQYEFSNTYSNWGKLNIVSDEFIKLSNYYLQLKQFCEFFNKNDILIIDFMELSLNPQSVINNVLKFLKLKPIKFDTFIVYNQTSGLFGKKSDKKRNMTSSEKDQIFSLLKEDMKLFGEEFCFDVSQWGF